MNQQQRQVTVGHVVDRLQDLADTLAASVPGLSVLERAAIWAEIQGLMAAERNIAWAVRRIETRPEGVAR